MDITIIIGFIGLVFGLMVAPPQLYKILKTKKVEGISKTTYQMLCICMVCYLIRAIEIKEWVFILSNGINLIINIIVLIMIMKYEGK